MFHDEYTRSIWRCPTWRSFTFMVTIHARSDVVTFDDSTSVMTIHVLPEFVPLNGHPPSLWLFTFYLPLSHLTLTGSPPPWRLFTFYLLMLSHLIIFLFRHSSPLSFNTCVRGMVVTFTYICHVCCLCLCEGRHVSDSDSLITWCFYSECKCHRWITDLRDARSDVEDCSLVHGISPYTIKDLYILLSYFVWDTRESPNTTGYRFVLLVTC